LHHEETALCVGIERDFMRTLEGGCTAPIGGYAEVNGDSVSFKGLLSAIDGKDQKGVFKIANLKEARSLGVESAKEILANGGKALMDEIKKVVKK
jgi:hydroxymethylbilane synthase